MPQRIIVLLATLTVCGPTFVMAQPAADKVQAHGQAPYLGKIKSITSAAVVISTNGREQTVSVNELANISFADEPETLSQIRRLVKSGQYEKALMELKPLANSTLHDKRIQHDVRFYQALATSRLALAGASELGAAGKMMFQFKKSAPDSHHYFEAVDVLGRLAMAMEQYKAATNFFRELAGAPWKDFQLKASVLAAEAMLKQGNHAEAIGQFRTALDSTVQGPSAEHQKALAGVGLAVCLAETGKAAEGRQTLLKILEIADPRNIELNAKAYNALGQCYLQQKNNKQALLAFLHTDLLYSGQRDAHAEALYHLTKLWGQLEKSDRARQARNTLKSSYAGSHWAKQL